MQSFQRETFRPISRLFRGKLDLLSGRRGKFSHQSRFEIDNNTGTGRIFNVGNSSSANSFSFLNGRGDDRVSIVILGFSLRVARVFSRINFGRWSFEQLKVRFYIYIYI